MFARFNQFHVLLLLAALISVLRPASAHAKTSAAKSADETLQPDIYPSSTAASAHLAREVADALRRAYANADKVPPILVRVDQSTAPCPSLSAASEELGRSLRDELGDRLRSGSNGDQNDGVDRVVVMISVENVTHSLPRQLNGPSWTAGMQIAQVSSARVSDSFDVEFSEKPWVTNWATFVNGASPGSRWFHAQSNKTCLTSDEAEAAARKAAAEQLAPFVRAQLTAVAAARSSGARARAPLAVSQLTASIDSFLRYNSSIVADRFVQRFQRPYGTVWQAQLLVDGSPAKVEAIGRQISAETHARIDAETAAQKQRTRDAAATGGSIFGLILVIIVLYLFLNAATKGYFTGRLRATAMLLMIVGAVGLYAMLHTRSPAVMIVPAQSPVSWRDSAEVSQPQPVALPATPAAPAAPAVSSPPPPQPPEAQPPGNDG